ncbi:MAG: hypothetical protein AAF291_16635 [Pseudomonadota bacterium]
MLDNETETRAPGDPPASSDASSDASATPPSPPPDDESIVEELGAVIDDAKLYAAAELAFQKTRAKLLGRNVGIAAGAAILAAVLLHIALITMAVGLVMALEPWVTIWGAIVIVVGMMLLGVALLGNIAISRGRLIGEMFANDDQRDVSAEDASAEGENAS